jgi:hypothetical protein
VGLGIQPLQAELSSSYAFPWLPIVVFQRYPADDFRMAFYNVEKTTKGNFEKATASPIQERLFH